MSGDVPRSVEDAAGELDGPRFRPRNSLDYLLRTVQQMQVQYSAMADVKANIMITVSSVVFSITLSRLDAEHLRWPLLTLCGFSLASLIAAILAVIPSATGGKQTPPPSSAPFNVLFFGHFNQLSQDDFVEAMARVTRDDEALYEALCRDIYGAGIALAQRKFRRLRISYTCFLVGVFVAALELAYFIWYGLTPPR